MKKILTYFIVIAVAVLLADGCSFLDPYPNGSYNEDNYTEYPRIIRGFIGKAYNLRPVSYWNTDLIGTDAASDDAVYRTETNNMRLFSIGTTQMTSNPFASVWTRGYRGIYYCNLFLDNDLGINTQYLVDSESDKALRKALQGDAYALRAYYHYELLKTFAGKGVDGVLYGVPLSTRPVPSEELDPSTVRRATFDETVARIIEDCDSSLAYIPYNNRDYPNDPVYLTPVTGSVRYKCFDQVSVWGLKAMTYLLWASPLYCQDKSLAQERYALAAQYASKVLRHKLEVEGTLGFDPYASILWGNGNNYDIILPSAAATSEIDSNLYPAGFKGSALIVPSQNLIDAFPMANGYPISDHRSGYDPSKPYEGRDPRFYATVFHDGSSSRRDNVGDVMYTFNCVYPSGADAPGVGETSPTSYYQRKFIAPGYNPFDANPVKGYGFVAIERWEQMCLLFAEAAAQSYGPNTPVNGITAKQAVAYVRSRSTIDDIKGIGAENGDPYLEECAANTYAFVNLVKNEWRICTCFEGARYYHLRRWASDFEDVSTVNVEVYGAIITSDEAGNKSYCMTNPIETRKYPSLCNPLPYLEVRRCPNLVQNVGWESWR